MIAASATDIAVRTGSDLDMVGPVSIVPAVDSSSPGHTQLVAVRAFDIAFAAGALIVALPLMACIAALVRLSGPGPVFYSSERVGQQRRPFGALKFRTMCANADAQLQALLDSDPDLAAEYREYFKLRRDPRITRVGGFLRKTNLDELPQLLNVLRGDMSLVGPRPKLPSEPALYGACFDTVLRVKPGLTGQWQVSGRTDITFDERIRIDLDYALHRTFRQDVLIIWKTILQMWQPSKHGAY